MKYRVWVRDIALQDIEVEAENGKDAKEKVNAWIKSDTFWEHVEKIDMAESLLEVESVEEIKDEA